MIIHNCEQRSEEWHALRIGRITGTRIKDLAGGKPPTVETLCYKIAAEKITGVSSEKPFTITPAMQHGIDTEEEALTAYEIQTLSHVERVGFIEKDDLYGCSPDGIIQDTKKGVEIKCPSPHTHLKYLTAPEPWMSYKWQVQGSLWVSGYDSWDFVSYCPSFPDDKKLLIETVYPDSKCMELLDEKANDARRRIGDFLRYWRRSDEVLNAL